MDYDPEEMEAEMMLYDLMTQAAYEHDLPGFAGEVEALEALDLFKNENLRRIVTVEHIVQYYREYVTARKTAKRIGTFTQWFNVEELPPSDAELSD